jgi:hypothetical protein
MVNKWMLVIFLVIAAVSSFAQKLTIPQLVDLLDWTGKRIDTTLKKKDYMLMHKDIDTGNIMYQYSMMDKEEDKETTTIRTFTYMDVEVRKIKSRLITYRTYDKDEYADFASYLLAHNYHSTGKFDFGEEQHTLYSNGQQTIRLKVITTKLKNGRVFTSYEIELGR